MTTATVANPSQLRFSVEAHTNATSPILQKILLFNYQTAQFDELDSTETSTTDAVVTVTVNANPTDYIEVGTDRMRALMTYKATGLSFSTGWEIRFDRTHWTLIE